MKHEQWNFRHQPVDEWCYFGQWVIQALLKSHLVGVCVFFQDARPILFAASAHLYLPGHAVQKSESWGEGIKHVVSRLILFLPLFSFDFFPLSYSSSLALSCQFTLPTSFSVISSLPPSLPPSFPPSLCLSLFQSLSSSLPFPSSSLPFSCSCSKEIIFSGFSTKLPWGTSRNIFPISLF